MYLEDRKYATAKITLRRIIITKYSVEYAPSPSTKDFVVPAALGVIIKKFIKLITPEII